MPFAAARNIEPSLASAAYCNWYTQCRACHAFIPNVAVVSSSQITVSSVTTTKRLACPEVAQVVIMVIANSKFRSYKS